MPSVAGSPTAPGSLLVAVPGDGHVGLATAPGFADVGHRVRPGKVPLAEPGPAELVVAAAAPGRVLKLPGSVVEASEGRAVVDTRNLLDWEAAAAVVEYRGLGR